MNITLDYPLIRFAEGQNNRLESEIRQRVFWTFFFCSLLIITTVILSVISANYELKDPLFYSSSSDAVYLKPEINAPLERQYITKIAQKWATQLMNIHFRTANEQILGRRHLFYEDKFDSQYLQPLRSGILNQIIAEKLVINAAPACFKQRNSRSELTGRICRAKLNAIYVKKGQWFYEFSIPLIQTRHDLSGKPSSRQVTFYMTLVSVPRTTRLEGLQIYSSGFNQGAFQ